MPHPVTLVAFNHHWLYAPGSCPADAACGLKCNVGCATVGDQLAAYHTALSV
jgi:hypothetical protein